MDFQFTEEQEEIRKQVRALCSRFPDEYWRERDETGAFPWDFYQAVADGGWLGITIPKEYGGSGYGNFGGVEATPIAFHNKPYSLTLTLPPLAAIFLKHQESAA